MDIKKARQLVKAARTDGRKFYSFDAYERLMEELYELLECGREEIDASRISDLCITGMKVLVVLEPKGSHETDPFAKQISVE